MIHYHGTPITPRSHLLEMAGRHFCVSFAHPADAETCQQIGQSVMFDNGAFTTFKSGKTFDSGRFYSWVERRLGHPHWAVVPDVIDGTEEQQKDRLKDWPFDPALGAPVWHLGLSLDYLLYLADRWPKICFGSSGEFWDVGSEKWANRVDEAFNILSQRQRFMPWVHMLRGLAMAGQRWPFASADSVNVARNHKDYGRSAETMASKIDRVQCPAQWAMKETQGSLL